MLDTTETSAAANDDHLGKQVKTLLEDWVASINRHDSSWFERHLTSDFSATAHPIVGLYLTRDQFIIADKGIKEVEVTFEQVSARRVGAVIVSQAVARMGERIVREAEPGVAGPSSDFDRQIAGKRVLYASAWRDSADGLLCFDHHLLGLIDE